MPVDDDDDVAEGLPISIVLALAKVVKEEEMRFDEGSCNGCCGCN